MIKISKYEWFCFFSFLFYSQPLLAYECTFRATELKQPVVIRYFSGQPPQTFEAVFEDKPARDDRTTLRVTIGLENGYFHVIVNEEIYWDGGMNSRSYNTPIEAILLPEFKWVKLSNEKGYRELECRSE
ncbi:MAG: hypothetical protein A2583_13825 [Bdellovibrionales bacterium RIFOXYD1_FULL_53_11]|nr:MAG: hypothetical protein A2583_13825 [Bdellovibrionales bacterium RIFOXYD1_FULL_53_11]